MTINQALAHINQMTELFRQHVRERDMSPDDLLKLLDAESFVEEQATHDVLQPAMEANEVTAMLTRAISRGMQIRVQDLDSDVDVVGNFGYGPWTSSAEIAWKQIVKMAEALEEDFIVQFKKDDEKVLGDHVHWIQIVAYGGNTPDDGWLCDGCVCDSMDGIL